MPSPASVPPDVQATFCATLVDEWIAHGVRHAVISPGSRSTVMALALAERDDLDLQVFHDERAAAFAALGIGLGGTPAILLCTSGTAAAHFHAAVIEADMSAVPILVCTADRPPELRDVGAPQTIDQTKLYGSSVRWFHDPGVASAETAGSWRSLAAHAVAAATGSWPGPVHLNLPFREPLVGAAGDLPERVATGAVTAHSFLAAAPDAVRDLAVLLGRERGVIVAGRGCGEPLAVHDLARAIGWPVLADARSGMRALKDVTVSSTDALLRSAHFAAAHVPDVVLRLGEAPASKVLAQWLAASAAQQVHVAATPTWTDPDAVIGRRLVAEPGELCRQLTVAVAERDRSVSGLPDGGRGEGRVGCGPWLAGWLQAEATAQAAIERCLAAGDLTEPMVARSVVGQLRAGEHFVVSNSMPIRDVEWYGVVPAGVTVHCNRGANGIDGVIATAIGVALQSSAATTLLIGDVAFLHDSSALVGLVARDLQLRILVVDNDGGGIFSFLPQAGALPQSRFERLFGTPHGVDLPALAGAHGVRVAVVRSAAELAAALSDDTAQVIVARTERAANVRAHDAVHRSVREAVGAMEAIDVVDASMWTAPT